jgi:hypothetical protein
MANIYPPSYPQRHQLEFPRGINRSHSPLGFGFGLPITPPSSSLSPSTLSPHNHQVAPPRPQKRRIESEDYDSPRNGDYTMDRSPTPERLKRGPPKRLRVAVSEASAKGITKGASDGKENKPPSSDIDVGVLLGPFYLCRQLDTRANCICSLSSTTVVITTDDGFAPRAA